MTTNSQIISSIKILSDKYKRSQQRTMVVLSGEKEWCFSHIKELVNETFLAVSNHSFFAHMHVRPAEKLKLVLGREFEGVVWDAFSGLNPDGLGIASGLLKGGGIFFLLLPPLDFLRANPDSDYIRMCSENLTPNDFNTFFLQRLVDHLETANDIIIFQEGKERASDFADLQLNEHTQDIDLPTQDQLAAINAIKKVSFGHRNRPLVIQANRGRGKSSALGLAAADIFLDKKLKTVITAPSKKTCEAAFTHYHAQLKSAMSSPSEVESCASGFEFLPLDYILKNDIDCHLLFIDEAAAIPASILNSLVGRFPRVVYSTTIHGYEGNGQGFAIRFKETLDTQYSHWRSITLRQPIRWLENDTLEPWFFRFLLLDARLPDLNSHLVGPLNTRWISQKDLYQDEQVFEQIVSLLVTAHYQTSPSDIRIILDHPHVRVLISYAAVSSDNLSKRVYGVCLSIEEGGIDSTELASDIISGKRRPRGQLFPQALCASSANENFMIQSTYRVMRIAVHPAMQQKGIGTSLLKALSLSAKANHIDSLSTSYGLSNELLSFWHKNHFQIVKLGTKVDGSSGLRSIMMMQAISPPAKQLMDTHTNEFFNVFIFNLNRQYNSLSTDIISSIIRSISPNTPVLNNAAALTKISAFANAARPFEETSMELFNWLIQTVPSARWTRLSEGQQELLISQILQDRNFRQCLKHSKLTGKKQRLTALRQAVVALLNTET